MNWLRYLIIAFCRALSGVSAANTTALTEARQQELQGIYNFALNAIREGDLGILRLIFAEKGCDINNALLTN